MDDPHELERFVSAQDSAATYEQAVEELLRGRKTSHWMWFVFPQFAGLGRSAASRRFAISSLEEAKAYLRHPVLGPGWSSARGSSQRRERRARLELFGETDAVKLRSSMTLFMRAAPDEPVFRRCTGPLLESVPDAATDELISHRPGR